MDTHTTVDLSNAHSDAVEELSAYDILVGDRSLRLMGQIPSDAADLIRFICEKWRGKGISSTEALKWLDNEDLLNPDDLMLGLAAISAARTPPPELPPAPAVAMPLPIEWPYGNAEMLEIVSKSRVA